MVNDVGGLHSLKFAHATLGNTVVMVLLTPSNTSYVYVDNRWCFNITLDERHKRLFDLTFDDLRPNEQMLVYEWLVS